MMGNNVRPNNYSAQRNRRSIRLKGYDYSLAGAYFVTICTQNRECLFGEIVNRGMELNDTGKVVSETWEWLKTQYDHVELDEWAIMPNHMHGILVITGCRGGSRTAPTRIVHTETAPTGKRKPIGLLIGAFKTVSTKNINELRKTPGAKLWQRNYYEHIIRDGNELNRIREYIVNNPMKWELDRENPDVGAVREPPLQEPPPQYGEEPWRI